MKKSTIAVMMPLFLGVMPSFGAPINLGSLATNNVAVLGYDSGFPTTRTVTETITGGSTFTVSGDIVTPVISGSGVTFASGTTDTSGPELTNAESDFTSLLSQLLGLTYVPITINSGAVNTYSTPGSYTLSNNNLGAGTVINLTGAGQYVFKVSSSFNMNGVIVNALNSSLSSDNVFFYVSSGATVINNSSVFGDVVTADGSSTVLEATSGLTGSLKGRFLSGGFNTGLTAIQASHETLTSFAIGVPEPSTFALFALGLGFVAFASRKRRA